MIQDLSPYEKSKYLERIRKFGSDGLEGISRLKAIQLLEVLEYDKQKILERCSDLALLNRSPKYPYPEQYRNGKEYYYWKDTDDRLPEIRFARGIINDFLKSNQTPESQTSSSKKTKSEDISKSTLMSIFRKPSEYDGIMRILVKEGYCQSKTFIWKFEKRGNKKLLASTIKFLHKQGYYKENKIPSGWYVFIR